VHVRQGGEHGQQHRGDQLALAHPSGSAPQLVKQVPPRGQLLDQVDAVRVLEGRVQVDDVRVVGQARVDSHLAGHLPPVERREAALAVRFDGHG
jgi:hypothetical protein